MRYFFVFFIIPSLFFMADDHDEMYQGVYADYTYCVNDDNLSQEANFAANSKWVEAWNVHANSFDNEVSLSVVAPVYTNEDMRDGSDFFFVKHAPSRKALGAFNEKMWELISADENMPEPAMTCENSQETFQRIGPSSKSQEFDDRSYGFVEYYPCNYVEGADPEAMRKAEAELAMEHYANGAKGGYRYIYPGSGSDRNGSPDFYISRGYPSFEARGESHDIYWSKTNGSEADGERRRHMSCQNSSLWRWWRLKES